MTARFALLLPLVLLAAASAAAHELRPGYLELREGRLGEFDVLWKVPARGEYKLGLDVRLPQDCSGTRPPGGFADDAYTQRWHVSCAGGLAGGTIGIEGLAATRTDVLVRIEHADGASQVARLTPDRVSFAVEAAPSAWAVTRTYFALGVEHILFGADHLLFVLGLLFLVGSTRRLVATVTAFTVAHSITLTAATLGLVRVAQAPVEAAIALSVVFVGAEIVGRERGHPGLASRAPWLVAFAFGLLHGFGFAGALREIGLPQQAVPLALLFFNLGVEAGQLTFIALIVLALWALRASAARLQTPVGYLVGSIAAFWLVERVVSFWS